MLYIRLVILSLIGLVIAGCGQNPPADSPAEVAPITSEDYYLYVVSGFPTASGVGTITRWSSSGVFDSIIHDYSSSPGWQPQGLVKFSINGDEKLLALVFNGTNARVDEMDLDGASFTLHFDNNTALTAGSRRISLTSDGGYLVPKTNGVERFNSARQRVGAPRYNGGGTCSTTATTSANEVVIDGASYVVTTNGAATPNNKLSLYNGATGTCIAGTAPASPGTLMWPVDAQYVESESRLFVLYYPFTASTVNAQIWSFEVSATSIFNGQLLYNDAGGDIAIPSATPASRSSALAFYQTSSERYFFVGTANNSVIKLAYDGITLTKVQALPLIYGSLFGKSISDIFAVAK